MFSHSSSVFFSLFCSVPANLRALVTVTGAVQDRRTPEEVALCWLERELERQKEKNVPKKTVYLVSPLGLMCLDSFTFFPAVTFDRTKGVHRNK